MKEFKRRGVPIDGVGSADACAHAGCGCPGHSPPTFARLTALGLQVHITELDVSLAVGFQRRACKDEDLNRQADIYRGIVRACLNSANCTAIQTWGFTDKYSWIGSHSHGDARAGTSL